MYWLALQLYKFWTAKDYASSSFLGALQNCEKRLLPLSCVSVCLSFCQSIHMEKYFPENRAVYEIMTKNRVHPNRPQRMRFSCWISEATMVTRTRLNVTFHVYFLSCCKSEYKNISMLQTNKYPANYSKLTPFSNYF